MRLDIRDSADLTADVVIYQPPAGPDGRPRQAFVVEARSVTRAQIEQLQKECHAVNQAATFLTEAERDERFTNEWQERAPDLYIKGWRGLTVGALAHLGIPLASPPETDADGCISYSPQIARQLWAKAYTDRFANKIALQARHVLEAHAIAERERKND